MRFHFLNISWGAEYTRMFLEEMLPTLLSPGNFAAPELAGRAKFVLYTTPADLAQIRASPAYRRLAQLMEVDLLDITELRERLGAGADKYAVMNACHCHAIRRVNEEGAAIVFLHPDFVIADGMCLGLIRQFDAGKSVVLLPAAHVTKDAFIEELRRRRGDLARLESWTIPPREMVSIALKTLNAHSRACFWDSPEVTMYPTHLWWRVGHSGFFIRGFHLHPIMVRPAVREVLPEKTFDSDFLGRACPDMGTYHFVEDSDEMSIFAMCPEDEFSGWRLRGRYSNQAIAAFVLGHSSIEEQHCLFARKILRFHAEELDGEWASVEAESSRILSQIFRLAGMNRPRNLPPDQWMGIYRSLLQAGARAA